MSNKPDEKTAFVDIPELSETFADSFGSLSFDGQVMKIELRTTIQGKVNKSGAPNSTQYPVCRLVLTPKASIELFNKLQVIMDKLEKDGVFKKSAPMPTTTPH